MLEVITKALIFTDAASGYCTRERESEVLDHLGCFVKRFEDAWTTLCYLPPAGRTQRIRQSVRLTWILQGVV